jgi:hypothetical protein
LCYIERAREAARELSNERVGGTLNLEKPANEAPFSWRSKRFLKHSRRRH